MITTEKEKVKPRTNGWYCPWHPLQYMAWFFVLFFALLHFGFLGHYVPGYWSIVIFTVPVILLVSVVLSMFMATTLDPAEKNFRHKMSSRSRRTLSRPTFDRTKHAHVIENNYCNLCQVNVSVQAKHCRVCDKCISHFDHHCKWLNNCVGGRNYRWFLAVIWSALVSLLLFLLYSLSLFILFFSSTESIRFNCRLPSNLTACDSSLRVFGGVVPGPVFPVLCGGSVFLSLIGVGLLGHLAFFHLYLKFKGLTTYEFLTESDGEKGGGDSKHNLSSCSCGLSRKGNKVSPAPEDLQAILPSTPTNSTPTTTATINSIPSPIVARLTDDTPPDDVTVMSPDVAVVYRHASTHSDDSVGMNTFGRTPPSSPSPPLTSPSSSSPPLTSPSSSSPPLTSPLLSPQHGDYIDSGGQGGGGGSGQGDDGGGGGGGQSDDGGGVVNEQKLGLLYGVSCDDEEEEPGSGSGLLVGVALEYPPIHHLTTPSQDTDQPHPRNSPFRAEGEESGDDVTLPMNNP